MTAVLPGLRLLERGGARVLLSEEIADAALAAGLDRPWEHVAPRPEGIGTGRGPRAVVALPDGARVLVKQYLRGGALALLNRERYPTTHRFERELIVGRAVRDAGLPAGEALGVVLTPARPFWRAWGLSRFIADAPDLAQLYAGPVAPGGRAVHDFVRRLHDAGLEHRDLNLGNLLGRIGPGGVWELFVVDLDRARWHGRPVAPAARARVEARLLRSWRKLFPGAPPFGGDWNR